MLRGDIVKDNSGSYAVFTEQGSSASQMTAAKIMDIISRLPGCDGQAADAVSAYTQVKMEDAHKLLKIPKSECPDIWIRLPRHKWPKSCDSIHDRFIRDKTFRKAMIELGRSEKIILEMDQLASENHTHVATRADIDVYRGNWWIR